MPCLVCGKRIPLLLRLSGSHFCSPAHERQPAALHGSVAIARPSPPPMMPETARFALSEPEVGPIGSQPERDRPIPKFQDLILCRDSFSVRQTPGLKSATTISSVPRASLPRAGRSIGMSPLNSWTRLRLSRSALEVSPMMDGRKAPCLQGAPAHPRGLVAVGAFARARGSRTPIGGDTRLEIRSPACLPARAALRAFRDAFPLSLDTCRPPAPRPSLNPFAGFGLQFVRAPLEPAHVA